MRAAPPPLPQEPNEPHEMLSEQVTLETIASTVERFFQGDHFPQLSGYLYMLKSTRSVAEGIADKAKQCIEQSGPVTLDHFRNPEGLLSKLKCLVNEEKFEDAYELLSKQHHDLVLYRTEDFMAIQDYSGLAVFLEKQKGLHQSPTPIKTRINVLFPSKIEKPEEVTPLKLQKELEGYKKRIMDFLQVKSYLNAAVQARLAAAIIKRLRG